MAKKANKAGKPNVVSFMETGKQMPKESWWTKAKQAAKKGIESALQKDTKDFKDDSEVKCPTAGGHDGG